MIKADFHLHSSFSGDSETPAEEQILAALKNQVFILCFTEHMDKDYPYDDICLELDTSTYFHKLRQLQSQWVSQLDIRIGVELGLQPHLSDFYQNYISQYPFDFVIGSTHAVGKYDPYYPSFWENRDPYESIRHFLDITLKNIRTFDDFDVYGHIDYIIRYVPWENKTFPYIRYADVLDEILKLLISKGKGIEVNTGGYKAGLGVPNPCPDILKRYRELGGEIITFGSDAHFSRYVGYCFEEAAQVLKDCGFKYFTVFKERKPEFLPL